MVWEASCPAGRGAPLFALALSSSLRLTARWRTRLCTAARAGKMGLARIVTCILELECFMSWRCEKPTANDFLKLLSLDALIGRYVPSSPPCFESILESLCLQWLKPPISSLAFFFSGHWGFQVIFSFPRVNSSVSLNSVVSYLPMCMLFI